MEPAKNREYDKTMGKKLFKPIEIIDSLTGQKRILSAEEQEEMLEKGIWIGNLQASTPAPQKENNNGK